MNAIHLGRSASYRVVSALLFATIFLLVGPPKTLIAEQHDCKALENSADRVPDWYGAQCGAIVHAPPPEFPNVPGDLYYAVKLFPAPVELLSAPLPTRTFTPHGPSTAGNFAADYDNAAAVLWGVITTNPVTTFAYGTVNESTGTFTSVGTVTGLAGGTTNVTGLSFDPTSSNVYLSAIVGSAATLYTVNLTTGVATPLGPMTGLVIDIAIDNSGQMYSHDIGGDQLLRVDKTNGVSTPVGPTGILANFAQGLDFDASDNTLYGFVTVNSPAINHHLGTFNLTTGAFTILASGGEELEGAVKVPAGTLSVAPLALTIAGGDGNLVFQPNETVTMKPRWRNTGTLPISLMGGISGFIGPGGPVYTVVDGAASYGTIAPGNDVECTDCYSLNITAIGRPVQHWDTALLETVNPTATAKTWTLHVGDSFTDVLPANPFYRFVETIFHRGITAGCGGTNYCPSNSTTREQMAVFVLVAKDGIGVVPPACAPPNTFGDVPESSPFCRFIEELANRGVVSGCGGGNYCPTDPVTREQMAVFVLKTLDPALDPPACAPPNLFGDVPESSPFCRFIEELANRGVVSGCGGGNYCPTDPVTREQMGVFLTVTFSLAMYGP